MNHKPKILSDLERIAPFIPAPMFWVDVDGVLLGCNELTFEGAGAIDSKQMIGKTPYDFYPKDVADVVVKNTNRVMQEKKMMSFEESIVDIETKKKRFFLTTRAPLFDDNGVDIIGTVGTSVEITERKELEQARIENAQHLKFKKIIDQAANDTKSPITILLVLVQQCSGFTKEQVFEKLKTYASSVPIGIYWLDVDNKVLGANKQVVAGIGGKDVEDFIGKTPYEFYPHDIAEHIVKHNIEVMRIGKVLSQEESIVDVTSGETKYFISFKAPLFDEKGNVIGIVGTSANITAEKTAKHLVLENERQRSKIMEQEKFASVAAQVTHDIRSPLASLSMIVKSCAGELSENVRVALLSAASSVESIANSLLSEYRKDSKEAHVEKEEREPVLISLTLLQLLTDKRHQYKDLPIKFEHEFSDNSNFVFTKAEPSAFKRMISNLVNNAVESFDDKGGKVTLKLISDDIQAKIIIEDNGKGIPEDILYKIKNNVAITGGKKDGHGIGLEQVRDTLKENAGEIAIESKIGKGTKITLTFPVVPTPEWLAREINLSRGDTVVVLDDDPSIHNAWEMRFKDYTGMVKLKHFLNGEEAIKFINATDKNEIVLLADYELLKQEINGLQVIKRTEVPRSILVTSHFNNHIIRNLANETDTEMLPKQLASEIPIKIVDRTASTNVINPREIDVVIIEDNNLMADTLAELLNKHGKKTDVYYDGKKFLKNFERYAKDTKICMDYSLGSITGVDIAEELHEAGYTKLYLITGWDRDTLAEYEVPDYLTVLLKTDTDEVLQALKS